MSRTYIAVFTYTREDVDTLLKPYCADISQSVCRMTAEPRQPSVASLCSEGKPSHMQTYWDWYSVVDYFPARQLTKKVSAFILPSGELIDFEYLSWLLPNATYEKVYEVFGAYLLVHLNKAIHGNQNIAIVECHI